MMAHDDLTNESIMKHFDNSFEVALYAIDIAKRLIKNGQEVELKDLLNKVEKNPEQFEIEEPIDLEEDHA